MRSTSSIRASRLPLKGYRYGNRAPRWGPRSTVRDWLAGRLPAVWHRGGTSWVGCGGLHDHDGLPPSYVYLLGMYLGDGCLSAHPRAVFKLRISLDARYPGIAEECERAMHAVMPANQIGRVGYGTI